MSVFGRQFFVANRPESLNDWKKNREVIRTQLLDLAERSKTPLPPSIQRPKPEDVVLHRDAGVAPTLPNRFEAKVGIGLFTGNSVEYYVDVDRTLIQARSPSRHPLKRGDSVHIELPADAIKTFVLEGEPKVRIGSRRLATLARVDDDGDS